MSWSSVSTTFGQDVEAALPTLQMGPLILTRQDTVVDHILIHIFTDSVHEFLPASSRQPERPARDWKAQQRVDLADGDVVEAGHRGGHFQRSQVIQLVIAQRVSLLVSSL